MPPEKPKIVNLIAAPMASLGGLQRTARDVERALRGAGAEVLTISPERAFELKPKLADQLAGHLYAWRACAPLARAALEGADLLVAHNGAGWGLGFNPCLRMWQNEMADYAMGAWPKWHPNYHKLRSIDIWCERRAAAGAINLAASERLARNLAEGPGVKAVGVIENAVDLGHFRPLPPEEGDRFREEHGLPKRPRKLLLFAGRPVAYKGLALLAEWADRFREELSIVVAGPDDLPPELAGKPNARAIGTVAYENLPRLYAAADFFALPSLHEGCSYSVIEAMACGIPSLLTDAGHVESVRTRLPVLAPWIASTKESGRLSSILAEWLARPEIPGALREPLRAYAASRHSMERFDREWLGAVASGLGPGADAEPPSLRRN